MPQLAGEPPSSGASCDHDGFVRMWPATRTVGTVSFPRLALTTRERASSSSQILRQVAPTPWRLSVLRRRAQYMQPGRQ